MQCPTLVLSFHKLIVSLSKLQFAPFLMGNNNIINSCFKCLYLFSVGIYNIYKWNIIPCWLLDMQNYFPTTVILRFKAKLERILILVQGLKENNF